MKNKIYIILLLTAICGGIAGQARNDGTVQQGIAGQARNDGTVQQGIAGQARNDGNQTGLNDGDRSKKMTDAEKAAFEQTMVEQAAKMKTLQCSFVQEKTSTLVAEKSVSKGLLLYQSPSMLRWEYTDPTPSALILNGKNAVLLDKNGKPQGNANLLKQLGNIIISMINGDGLRQNKQFSTEVFDCEQDYLVILTPVQKRLKEFYQSIELKLNKETLLASEIVMNEKSGDKTVIYLNDKVLNKEIDNNKFAVK